jgi:uncharacterized membrane protein SpoIIM required for sporulation
VGFLPRLLLAVVGVLGWWLLVTLLYWLVSCLPPGEAPRSARGGA